MATSFGGCALGGVRQFGQQPHGLLEAMHVAGATDGQLHAVGEEMPNRRLAGCLVGASSFRLGDPFDGPAADREPVRARGQCVAIA